MFDRKNVWGLTGFLAVTCILFVAGGAQAYVGPGAGLELVGYFISLLTWLGVAFFSVLLWPFYSLMQRFRRKPTQDSALMPVPEEAISTADAA